MNYRMFLDDERYPPAESADDIVIARNFDDAVWYVQNWGVPYFISFDHDLGKGKDGYDFAKWLTEHIIDSNQRLPEYFDFYVHSMNPVGKENIQKYMENFMNKMGYIKL